jgi:hypothetical protein
MYTATMICIFAIVWLCAVDTDIHVHEHTDRERKRERGG